MFTQQFGVDMAAQSIGDQPPGLLTAGNSAVPGVPLSCLWYRTAGPAPTVVTAFQPVGSREDKAEGKLLPFKNRAQRLYTTLPLLCYGPEFGNMVTLVCKGVWEV